MMKYIRFYGYILIAVLSAGVFCAFRNPAPVPERGLRFPYAKAGLTQRQAAAHLISRFTYGATPGQVDAVVKEGLEHWFDKQLAARLPEGNLDTLLKQYDALAWSNAKIADVYRRNGEVLRMAEADGVIVRDSAKAGSKAYRETLRRYREEKGFRPERDLVRQFVSQKILRTVYSRNQLQEVLTEFWSNHFNVSFAKPACSRFIPAYERDVIRPHALGRFEDLLVATAQAPAMLLYLDNFSSVGAKDSLARRRNNKRQRGLNENYAREVMELHTLGVDGGYTQADVTEAARVLTGWTIYPLGNETFGSGYKKLLDKAGEQQLAARGFVHQNDFLFTPNRHDAGEKTILGKHFPAGGGYDEGKALLHMLAQHPATASFIATKLATRFVSDTPPRSLTDRMAKTFRDSNGDIRQVLRTMVASPEFWDSTAVRAKTKSPLELVASSLRALNATIKEPYALFEWLKRMGQPIYFYQAPTGFPDRAQYWINTGALLNRMNFGLALADGKIKGAGFDLLALNGGHEPESAEDALVTYSSLLLPERDTKATMQRLTPLLSEPALAQKVSDAASKDTPGDNAQPLPDSLIADGITAGNVNGAGTGYRLAQVLGILLGSPEFQRR